MAYCACPMHRYMAAHIYNDMLITFLNSDFCHLHLYFRQSLHKSKNVKKNFLTFFGFEHLASLKNLQ